MKLTFSGTHALVLGGTCDLALTLAGYMIEAGLIPILTYRDEEGSRRIAEKLEAVSGRYRTVFLDFSNRSSVDALFPAIGDDLSFVVDLAQGDFESFIASADEDAVARYFFENISVRAGIIKEASRVMLAGKKGRFVFVSSAAALRSNPGQGFYAAAKLASEALYRNTGLELGKRGITAVTLRPGYIGAGRGRTFVENHEKKISDMIPTGKTLTKEEVAETILFLLSDSAADINATEILMDGGMSAAK
jgi:3-oxoacyl-[acyl-carrier protein] reductase